MGCFYRRNEVLQCVTEFFNKPEYSDVTVRGPIDEEYYCSKMMLCAQSEVFERMFKSRMVETSTGEVHIKQVSADALEVMLYFMHTGICEITDLNFFALWAVADRFQVKNLLTVCKEYERDRLTLTSENVSMLLTNAMVFERQNWVERCVLYITQNMAGVIDQDEFQELPFNLVEKLVNSLEAEEQELTPKEYFHFTVGLITWLSCDKAREKHFSDIFQKVDLSKISGGDVNRLCEMKYVQESPELALGIVKALGESSRRKTERNSYSVKARRKIDIW